MNPSHKMFLRMAGTIVLAVVGAGLAVSSAVYAAETVDASDDDRCYALKYTSNGKELITNLVCKDSNGVPYVPTNGPVTEGSNPKFTVNTAGIGVGKGMVLLNHNNNEGTGGVKVEDGHELTDELLKEVVKKACGDSMTCGSYQFSDGTISAAKNDEVWETFTQVEVPESSNDSEGEKTCASSGNSLGWILCPVLDLLSGAAETVYDDFVKPALQVEPQLFNAQNNPTRSAWTTFQMIANVAFIVLLLVVIFSQLTGVGIDNYGIKKILPKLIIAAVLINLSYLICIIAVDLSNILGNGLQALFDGISPTPEITSFSNGTETASYSGDNGGGSITGGFASVGLLAALGVGTVAVIYNPAILLSLLVAALGIVVAIFFLFILLAGREAAVVVLTVISPLAFACFMLPNTKKLFDKWWKFGQGLLIVYPICGLLIGGGNYVSKLILNVGGSDVSFMTALTAMLIGVAPIFFIPSVIKGSFAAMGKMGATITSLGTRARGATTKAVRGTEGYKNAQKMGLDRRIRMKAGVDKNGNLTATGRAKTRFAQSGLGKFVGSNTRLNAYTAAAKKNIAAGEEANAAQMGAMALTGIANAKAISGLGDSFGDQTVGAFYGRQFLDAAGSGDISGMNAAIKAMKSSGMKDKDIAKLMRHSFNSGAIKLSSDVKSNWSRQLATQYGGDFLATDYELNDYLRSGGSGVLGNYGERFESGRISRDDLKPEDFMRMSGDSMAAAAATGYYTQGMAQQVQARNPNMSEDKQIMTGAVASGAATQDSIKLNGGSVSANAGRFKDDAKTLMIQHGAKMEEDGGSIRTINTGGNSALVDQWVAPAAQRVQVEDPIRPPESLAGA